MIPKNLRPILQPKKEPKVTDPPRYPKIINGYEDTAKRMFSATLGNMIKELADKMIEIKKHE